MVIGRQACGSLRVADSDADYREWSAKGLAPGMPKMRSARTFSLHDPAGNTIFVLSPLLELNR
jgi:hypothetical protein